MRKFLIPAALFSLAIGTPAEAASWYYIGDGDNDIFYADGDSVVRNGDVVTLTLFDGLGEGYYDVGNENSPVYYYEGRSEYNCVSKQFREISRTGYNDNYESIGAIEYEGNWQTIQPNTFANSLYEFGCLGMWREDPIPDTFEDADYFWYGF